MGLGGQTGSATRGFSWEEVETACKGGQKLVVIDGNVCDVASWVDHHPGGRVSSRSFAIEAVFQGMLHFCNCCSLLVELYDGRR